MSHLWPPEALAMKMLQKNGGHGLHIAHGAKRDAIFSLHQSEKRQCLRGQEH